MEKDLICAFAKFLKEYLPAWAVLEHTAQILKRKMLNSISFFFAWNSMKEFSVFCCKYALELLSYLNLFQNCDIHCV